jgi:Fe-S cluster assembly scaffold protein SufB
MERQSVVRVEKMLDKLDKDLLNKIADMNDIPAGAYNIRKNGKGVGRNTTKNIRITNKVDHPGIDVIVKPGTKNESAYVPVILSDAGLDDTVYNTFVIGEDADVTIVAGCGIHNEGETTSKHDGVHEFFVKKGAKMKYIEKHYGEGDGLGHRELNPTASFEIFEDATVELEMVQIKGVDHTIRKTDVILHDRAKLIITERLLTNGGQTADSYIDVRLAGEDSSCQVISRSVAQGKSKQRFYMTLTGEARSKGHIQCDSIIADQANVESVPKISSMHAEAELIHEAAIGRIANDQLTKLMTIGIDEKEAEEIIIKGFLGN